MSEKHGKKPPPPTFPLSEISRREGCSFSPENLGAWQPPTDIYETDDALIVFAEIPGMDENDIEIEFKDNQLIIRGEKKRLSEDRARCCYCIERTFGAFRRVFTLRAPIDKKNIAATYNKGMLRIVLPKKGRGGVTDG